VSEEQGPNRTSWPGCAAFARSSSGRPAGREDCGQIPEAGSGPVHGKQGHGGHHCNTTFVFLIVIVLVIVLEQAGWRSVVINRLLAGAALVIAAVILLVRPLIPHTPFKVGNMVQLGGLLGKVEAITLINTRLKSFDGRHIFIPNQKILNETVVNYHFTPDRQIRLSVTIRYSDDLLKAKKILTEIVTAEAKVKEKPAPKVYLVNLGDKRCGALGTMLGGKTPSIGLCAVRYSKR